MYMWITILLGSRSGFCASPSCKKSHFWKNNRNQLYVTQHVRNMKFYCEMLLCWHWQIQCCCFSLHTLWGKESLAFESQVKVKRIVKGEQCERWLGWLGVFAPPGPSLKNPSQHKQAHTLQEVGLDFHSCSHTCIFFPLHSFRPWFVFVFFSLPCDVVFIERCILTYSISL